MIGTPSRKRTPPLNMYHTPRPTRLSPFRVVLLWSTALLTMTHGFQNFVTKTIPPTTPVRQQRFSSKRRRPNDCYHTMIRQDTKTLHPHYDFLSSSMRSSKLTMDIEMDTRNRTATTTNKKREHEEPDDPQYSSSSSSSSRRDMLKGMVLSTTTAAVAAASFSPVIANAGQPELDKAGMLYSPKSEMLSGGSQAARGIPLDKTRSSGLVLKPGQALQSVYSTRFIAYLSRFLLNFDPNARAWGRNNGLVNNPTTTTMLLSPEENGGTTITANKFAEFAESVEVGLADYFVGPYGSYSSVSAAKAGMLAAAPVKSAQPLPAQTNFWDAFLKGTNTRNPRGGTTTDTTAAAKQGVLNLYALLKARYTTVYEKKQLAILFSFITNPKLQPTAEIRSLLGEADNATVSKVSFYPPKVLPLGPNDFRRSSRLGGGYAYKEEPLVSIESPPALGDDYKPAKLKPIMEPTSRILRITVTDGGEGYTEAPQVTILQNSKRACLASAILDRNGHVESVIVLDPGMGYREEKDGLGPKVVIYPPKTKANGKPSPKNSPTRASATTTLRQATAVAELEYEVIDIAVVEGGNGYVSTEPPRVSITLPEDDPDWFLDIREFPLESLRGDGDGDGDEVRDKEKEMIPQPVVVEMLRPDGNFAYQKTSRRPIQHPQVATPFLLNQLKQNPFELLPSFLLPKLIKDPASPGSMIYAIQSIPPPPLYVNTPSPRFRAVDPIFGGVGSVPVTKDASALKPGEYGRLALSGAVCTIFVRTLLNPLELIKTKQQLKNDDELFAFARKQILQKQQQQQQQNEVMETSVTSATITDDATPPSSVSSSSIKEKEVNVGTIDLIQSMIALRGPKALFQSADITLLASLVFGSFGFGATELFRRYFTAKFFTPSDTGGDGGSEIILLFAAGVATVITSAAAAPFEVLRVRSMGLLESEKWTNVLQDFLASTKENTNNTNTEDFKLTDLTRQDLVPLFAGFAPTLSRELPFGVTKFLVFDTLATTIIAFINSQAMEGALPIQVGVGPIGLGVSAISGALAGVAGAVVSHPADLILTYTSASKKKKPKDIADSGGGDPVPAAPAAVADNDAEWIKVVKELTSREGGIANLYVGLPARATFFFLVIGLQFFLYDFVKGLFQVGKDDLDLVLDVFYAVRAGLQ